MSVEQLIRLKEQIARLTPAEKLELAKFLEEDAASFMLGGAQEAKGDEASAVQKRAQHMAWLRAHREEYAGLYVALDGDRLVGKGATIREAHDQAKRQGIAHPFLTHISSASDAPFGGW
jgi:hypothetical protein